MPTFVAAIDQQRYTDGDDSEGSYLIIQAARDTGSVQYKLQNATYLFLTLRTKICPRELASAIYCIAPSCFSLQRAKTSNSQIHRVTEWTVCMWVMSKLTYWYIRDVCSVASCAKGYQALPLLTVHRCHAGGEPGNEASLVPRPFHPSICFL